MVYKLMLPTMRSTGFSSSAFVSALFFMPKHCLRFCFVTFKSSCHQRRCRHFDHVGNCAENKVGEFCGSAIEWETDWGGGKNVRQQGFIIVKKR